MEYIRYILQRTDIQERWRCVDGRVEGGCGGGYGGEGGERGERKPSISLPRMTPATPGAIVHYSGQRRNELWREAKAAC